MADRDVTEAILANFHPSKYPGGSWTINPEEMEAAVRPIIEAQVRAQIAEDLDDVADAMDLAAAQSGYRAMAVTGMRSAADIARGDA